MHNHLWGFQKMLKMRKISTKQQLCGRKYLVDFQGQRSGWADWLEPIVTQITNGLLPSAQHLTVIHHMVGLVCCSASEVQGGVQFKRPDKKTATVFTIRHALFAFRAICVDHRLQLSAF